MRKMGMIALLLVLGMLLSVFASCNTVPGGSESESKSESETESDSLPSEVDPKWDGVDFHGEDLIINVSVNDPDEQTFGAADIYSRGPESIGDATDTVTKMIYDRNITLKNTLNVNVIWEETDVPVRSSQAIIEQFVKLSPENTPDIFINDIPDIISAMLTGSLKNVYHNYKEEAPEDGERNYFDFDAEGWYKEYMQGTTMRQDKLYMVTGDYFIDMIRWSYVIYVNRVMFDEEMAGIDYDMELLYDDVMDRAWDYEWFTIFIETAAKDTHNDGVYDVNDGDQVGFISCQLVERVFLWTTGLSILEWEGEEYNSKAHVIANNSDMYDFMTEFTSFYNATGIMQVGSDVLSATTLFFLGGNALFTLSKMGEMESEDVRNSDVQKGLVPVPLYDAEVQEDYYTLVHNQTEIACILNNVRRFSAATAYLQLANERSVDTLKEYYEKTLKLKYTEDVDTKGMVDLIHDRIVSPFESNMSRLIVSGGGYFPGAPYTGTEMYNIVLKAAKGEAGFQSSYTSSVEGWDKNLTYMEEIFNGLT